MDFVGDVDGVLVGLNVGDGVELYVGVCVDDVVVVAEFVGENVGLGDGVIVDVEEQDGVGEYVDETVGLEVGENVGVTLRVGENVEVTEPVEVGEGDWLMDGDVDTVRVREGVGDVDGDGNANTFDSENVTPQSIPSSPFWPYPKQYTAASSPDT
jgi:hypothetical protein